MAPALVPKIIKRQAKKLINYVGARICHEYDEAILKGHTFMRQANVFKKIVVKELNYFRRPNIHEASKSTAWQQAAPARAAKRAEAARTAELRWSKAMLHMPSAYQEYRTQTSYIEEVRSTHPASDDHVERSNCIQAGLASILGPERMRLGVGLPSGHSGIDDDPILAKYNTDKRIQDTKDVYEQYQTMLRQQREQQQHKEAEEAAARQSKQTELDEYRLIYEQRVKNLVALGPEFRTQTMRLLQAYEQGDFQQLRWALSEIIGNVLEKACKIFVEMQDGIMLELLGASELKNAWPLEAIDQIFTLFHEQAAAQFPENEQNGLGYMIHGIQFICQPIIAAREWFNPLMQQTSSNLAFVAAPVPISFEQFAASVGAPPLPQQPQDFVFLPQQPRQSLQQARSYQPAQSYQQPQVQQVQPQIPQIQLQVSQVQPQVQQVHASEQAADTGKNYSSFSDLLKASKAKKDAQAPSIFSLNPAAAQPEAPVASFLQHNKDNLQVYINKHVLDFQANVEEFLKEGWVNKTKCQENKAIMQWMQDYAQDEKGLLGRNDSIAMKAEIMRMIVKIDALNSSKEKDVRLIKDTRGLAKKILQIWA